MSDSDSLLLVGRVSKAHGVRGELKIIPETDDPERLEDLTAVFVGRTAGTAERREIESIRLQPVKQGTVVVMKMAGVDSREDTEAFRQMSVFADVEDLPPLEEDEFFIHDLIGLDVFDEEGGAVGRVTDVLHLPAQDVLVVARSGKDAAMIPVVDEFIVEIDVDEGRIVVRPIEGLL
ncbi:MAG: ribosome maturation factor RimM [Rhodothermales bacterium]